MSKRIATVMVGTVLCVLTLGLLGGGAWGMKKAGSPPGPKVASTVKLDGNNWEIYIDNLGKHTVSLPGSKPGGYWPKGSGRNYIFGGGIWVGVLNHTTKPDTQVTWGYNPNSGQSEFCPCTPDGDASKYLDATAKVYLSTNPSDKQVWPEKDSTGKIVIRSAQDSWTKFADWNPVYMTGGDLPIGVEVKRITYAWPYAGFSDIVYFLFWVKNVTAKTSGGARTLTDVILGNNMDCDIGGESGTSANDLCFLENSIYNGKTRNLAVQYQLAQEGGWSIPPPYFVGFKFFEGPTNNTGQTIHITSQPTIGYPEFDHDILPGQPLGMTAFQIFTIDVDPSTAWDRYMELQGYYYKTPSIYNAYEKDTFGPSDKRFLQCSGPFTLAPDSVAPLVVGVMGGLDSTMIVKNADKAQDIYDSGFLAPFPPVAPNLTAAAGDHKVTLVWDNLSEISPDPYYDQISDTSAKKKYRQYDFEGYRVYKARSVADLASPTARKLLANYDLRDGFTIVRDANWTYFTNYAGEKESLSKWDTLGTDSGIRYMFVDSGQVTSDSMGMVNGIPYFYGITGVDYQYYDSAGQAWAGQPTSLEGSATEKMLIVVPRTNPGNVTQAVIDSNGFVWGGAAYPKVVSYSPHVAVSKDVTNHLYVYRWNPVALDTVTYPGTGGGGFPSYSVTIRDSTSHQDEAGIQFVADTVTTLGSWNGVAYRVPIANGISFGAGWRLTPSFKVGTITPAPSYTDTVFADTGAVISGVTKWTAVKWAARGSLLKITWIRTGGSTGDSLLTVTVRDSTNRVDIPFEGGRNVYGLRTSSWGLGVDVDSVGYQYIDSVSCAGAYGYPKAKNARWLYVSGFRYLFNFHTVSGQRRPDKMIWARRPANGEVWYIQQAGPNAPVDGNWLAFTPTAQAAATGGKALLDAIKVVPNPYLVRNNWDLNKLDKHLMFTHLPTVCTIRIYTLAGDLVKILYHDGSQNSFKAMGGTTPTGGTGGAEFWDLLSLNDQRVASGIYLFHVDAPGIGTKIGKFAIIQ